ncbi:FMN-binding protein [Mesorhizobium sp. AR02]|uniref:FMN-binding protein n=1 Tax=Mesorhizobium sp. AR02 TaxID=2865837 RepID=UPI00215E34EC|nr:FMN-binding protein [Mesorhizobium sp. AR02]UVK55873.1 FMN-binding protein [Mesorhizobium sp. AR02]
MKQIALSLFVIASSGAYVAYVWDQAGKGPAGDLIDAAGPANATKDSVLQTPLDPAPARAGAVAPFALTAPAIERQGVRLEPPATRPATVGSEITGAIAAPAPKQQAASGKAAGEQPIAASQPQFSTAPAPEQTPAQLVADAAPQAASFAVTPAVYIPVPQPRPDYPRAPVRVIKAGMKATVGNSTKPAGHGFADGTYTGPVADAYYGLIQIQASIQGGRLTALKVLKYPSDRRTSISINRQALPMLRDEAISAQSANVDIISGATLTSRAFRQSLGGALKQASS